MKQRGKQRREAEQRKEGAPTTLPPVVAVKEEEVTSPGRGRNSKLQGVSKLDRENRDDATLARLGVSGGGPQKVTVAGVEIWFWSAEVRSAIPKGILFLAHGANHGAYDFFSPREVHGGVGLPEERALLLAARRRGYACVAVSSVDRRRKIWVHEVDGPRVARVLGAMARAFMMPVHALGVSNGAAFVFHLALYIKIDALCSQIMALDHDILAVLANQKGFPARVCFAHMPRDTETASAVRANVGALNSDALVAGRTIDEFELKPAAITEQFFVDRLGYMYPLPKAANAVLAGELVKALKTRRFLDAEDRLLSDPRRSSWRGVLRPVLAKHGAIDSFVADESPMAEVLNVAYGLHECCATHCDDVFAFLLDEDER